MENFIKHFVRESNGAWRCVSAAELETDFGRLQVTEGARFTPGTILMNVDIVKWLEEELERIERQKGHRI